jgi:hypothetical protein
VTTFRTLAWMALPTLLAATAAHAQEPPQPEGLECRVRSLETTDGLRLAVAFSNAAGSAIELPPAPHLVLYRDAAATDPMEHTLRVDRVQQTPLVVPAGGEKTALLGAATPGGDALRCNPHPAAAAALYFYRFSRRPTFRCVLRDYPAGQPAIDAACTGGGLGVPPAGPR